MPNWYFRYDDLEGAKKESKLRGGTIYEIVDKRSVNPVPRMYAVGDVALNDLMKSSLWKRMWTHRVHEEKSE